MYKIASSSTRAAGNAAYASLLLTEFIIVAVALNIFLLHFLFSNSGVVCSDILSIVGNELNFHIGTTGGQLSNSNASTGGLRFGHDIFPDLK